MIDPVQRPASAGIVPHQGKKPQQPAGNAQIGAKHVLGGRVAQNRETGTPPKGETRECGQGEELKDKRREATPIVNQGEKINRDERQRGAGADFLIGAQRESGRQGQPQPHNQAEKNQAGAENEKQGHVSGEGIGGAGTPER